MPSSENQTGDFSLSLEDRVARLRAVVSLPSDSNLIQIPNDDVKSSSDAFDVGSGVVPEQWVPSAVWGQWANWASWTKIL
jgi:hypothetical protein